MVLNESHFTPQTPFQLTVKVKKIVLEPLAEQLINEQIKYIMWTMKNTFCKGILRHGLFSKAFALKSQPSTLGFYYLPDRLKASCHVPSSRRQQHKSMLKERDISPDAFSRLPLNDAEVGCHRNNRRWCTGLIFTHSFFKRECMDILLLIIVSQINKDPVFFFLLQPVVGVF